MSCNALPGFGSLPASVLLAPTCVGAVGYYR